MLCKFYDLESACSGNNDSCTLKYTVNTEEVVQCNVLMGGFHHYYLVGKLLSLYWT